MKRNPRIIKFFEHSDPIEGYDEFLEELDAAHIEFCGPPIEFMGKPEYLGISRNEEGLEASLYVGTQWVVKDRIAVAVYPKFANVDFVSMLSDCLSGEFDISSYLNKCYGINFEEPEIESDILRSELTILMIFHYLSALKSLVSKGLRKDYILKEENFNSKIRGKVKLNDNLRKNVIPKRLERVFCQFSELSVDNTENRILKRALILCNAYITKYQSKNRYKVKSNIQKFLTHFANVSDNCRLTNKLGTKRNKLFREYSVVLPIATMIIRYFGNSLTEASSLKSKGVPFWINMPLIYEIYVLGKLRQSSSKIDFQVAGHHNKADFVIKKDNIILDAKYRWAYLNDMVEIEDIREISGYARDEKILNITNPFYAPICFIIYPGDRMEYNPKVPLVINSPESDGIMVNQGEKIGGFRNFYKISIPLPKLQR